jgi:hypothetical protein
MTTREIRSVTIAVMDDQLVFLEREFLEQRMSEELFREKLTEIIRAVAELTHSALHAARKDGTAHEDIMRDWGG